MSANRYLDLRDVSRKDTKAIRSLPILQNNSRGYVGLVQGRECYDNIERKTTEGLGCFVRVIPKDTHQPTNALQRFDGKSFQAIVGGSELCPRFCRKISDIFDVWVLVGVKLLWAR
jgi:hypothetical protein